MEFLRAKNGLYLPFSFTAFSYILNKSNNTQTTFSIIIQNEHDAKEHLLQYLSFYDIEKTYRKEKKSFSKRGICIYI